MEEIILKNLKKGICFVLSIAMLSAAVAGCNTNKSASSEPEEGKRYTITWAADITDPEATEMAQYYEEKLNIDLELWAVPNAEALNLRLAAGEIPDRFSIDGFSAFNKYCKQGLLAEIPAESLEKYAPTLSTIYKENYPNTPGALEYAKMDGKIMALPDLNYDTKFRTAIAYRGDWMQNLGVEKTPETLADFEKLMYQFTNEDPDKNGEKDTYGISQSGMNIVYGAYGFQVGGFANVEDTWIKDGDKLVYGPVTPDAKEALATLRKWYADGVLDPEFITGENTGGYWPISHSFINGRIGCTARGAFYHYRPAFEGVEQGGPVYLEFKKINPEAADAMKMGVPPVGTTGKRGIFKWNMLIMGIGIGKQVEEEPGKLEKMLEFMDYIVQDLDHFKTAHYGIEGKDWKADNEYGLPEKIDDVDWKDIGAGGTFFSVIPPRYKEALKYPAYNDWTYNNEFDKYGINNELMTSLPSEQRYTVELKKIQEEAYLSIITGKQPLDYFDEFVKNWYASGGEQQTKEANEWYSSIQK